MTEVRTILGIDPGTNLLGFGVVRIGERKQVEYVDMGVLDIRVERDPYSKLSIIYDFTSDLLMRFHPDALAIESPFMDKNAQVMFKLGRAQGAAIVAARKHGIPVNEYAPRKAKISICGNGAASKEQVAVMVQKLLGIKIEEKYFDATDALAIAVCHYFHLTSPLAGKGSASSWEKFVKENPDRVNKK